MAVLAPLAVPLLAVGTGMSAVGMVMQGRQASAAAKAQAQLDEANARIAANNAALSDEATARQLAQSRSQMRRLAGSQESAVAKSGLTLSGSALDVMNDSELEAQIERQDIHRRGAFQAAGLLNQSSDFRAQAAISRAAGRNAMTNAFMGAGGTLLSGAGQVGYMSATLPSSAGTAASRGFTGRSGRVPANMKSW